MKSVRDDDPYKQEAHYHSTALTMSAVCAVAILILVGEVLRSWKDFTWLGSPFVWIQAAFVTGVLVALIHARRRRRFYQRLIDKCCPLCGYDLKHLPSRVCPECGWHDPRPE